MDVTRIPVNVPRDVQASDQQGLYVHSSCGGLSYADAAEDRLVRLFADSAPQALTTPAVRSHITDWATRYHLAPQRANIFRGIQELVDPTSAVLEVGAGLGALTGWLAERVALVDAVEGTLKRASGARYRTRACDNVTVIAGNASAIEFGRTYDLITVVGVLEYAPFYAPGAPPDAVCVDFLQHLTGSLADDGILLVAIENKLGAKYLSGCAEDHTGKPFSGVSDYPSPSPVTFSRHELESLLRRAGLAHQQFYGLFPDYKFPAFFFREDRSLEDAGVSGVIRGLFDQYTGQREHLFHDALFLETLRKARLFHEFANSFLVLASRSPRRPLRTDWYARKISNHEGLALPFHHRSDFVIENQRNLVKKFPAEGVQRSQTAGCLQWDLPAAVPIVAGVNLHVEALKAVQSQDPAAALASIVRELKALVVAEFGSTTTGHVSGEAIDCCLWNVVRTAEGRLAFVDRKWKWQAELPCSFVLFRSLFYLFHEAFPYIKCERSRDFVIPILRAVDQSYDLTRFTGDLAREVTFQSLVRGSPVTDAQIDPLRSAKSLALQRAARPRTTRSRITGPLRSLRRKLVPLGRKA